MTSVGVEQLRNVVPSSDKRPAVAQPLPKRAAPHFLFLVAILGLPALLLAACGDDDGEAGASGDKIQVITTLPLFADFVRNIGGDRVEVFSLVPNGADPHTFEPSPRDVERITEVDIAFANGLGLDESTAKVIGATLRDGVRLVRLGERIRDEQGSAIGGDPHLWMNPLFANLYATTIRFELADLDMDSGAEYQQNWEKYTNGMSEVSSYVSGRVEMIPAEQRTLVTTHKAFTHFADAFGLEARAAVADSPGQEPSPQDIADLREVIEREGVTAVFTEPQISAESEILEQAAEDAGVQVCTLYSDSLDDRVTTYIEMMRFNADELVRCLGTDDGG